jgi:AcrR family transcriptional regulator
MARIAGITREQSEEKILNAALFCLANLGDKATTFRSIAERAGVSPALVGIYFKNRDELFPKVLDYVIREGRLDTVRALEEAQNPIEKLKAYFRVSIEFFRATPDRAKIYLQLYHVASFDDHYRMLCRDVKEVAVKRVEVILEAGERAGHFQIKNRALTARMIHTGVIGLLLSIITTEQAYPDSVLIQQFESMVLRSISA